jgi:hypothetical protein
MHVCWTVLFFFTFVAKVCVFGPASVRVDVLVRVRAYVYACVFVRVWACAHVCVCDCVRDFLVDMRMSG